jgi:multidrug efflux pump
MQEISAKLNNKYPGVVIEVKKNAMGPPTGNPINIEIRGEDFVKLTSIANAVERQIEKEKIKGIENLNMDLELSKPELIVKINREKARRFGLSTLQIASSIRTSLFGKEISDFKDGEDEYPIQLRLAEKYRNNVSTLLNQKLSFKKNGELIQIPISAIANISYGTTYGSIKRNDLDRVITLSSNVIEGYNANEINQQLKPLLANFDMPEGYKYQFTGEQQDQQESMSFLFTALIIAVSLILIILVTQFNSLIKPLIIIASVIFSTIGVFGGIAIFNMDIVVIMTGIGIISLAGVVVNNAIVLIDYIELLKERKRKELGLDEGVFLPVDLATECIVQAGKTRLRPVLLTAITTILGLLPMAVGLNINFSKMLSEFKPEIYFGGDMVAFWGPIAWTVIFGLTFATILTLVVVPVMYRISILGQKKFNDIFNKKDNTNKQIA